SHFLQSYCSAQYFASFCIVASCTPWESSATVSLSGHRVAWTRRFRSARDSSEKWTRNGRIESPRGGVTRVEGGPWYSLISVPASPRVVHKNKPKHPTLASARQGRVIVSPL